MSSSKHLPADQRRHVTVEAVVDLASRQNPSDITTASIASHMGVTQGALFRHFPNKEAIWEKVMEWVAEALLGRLDRAVEGIADPLDALQAMFTTHVEFVIDHPGVPRMMFGELQRPGTSPAKRMAQTLLRRYAERVAAHIETGKARDLVHPGLDTAAAVVAFVGAVQGLVVQSLLSGSTTQMRKDAPRVFAIFRRGIEASR